MHAKFWSKNVKGRDHLEDIRVDGKITLDLMHLAQGSPQWRALVDTVMKLPVP